MWVEEKKFKPSCSSYRSATHNKTIKTKKIRWHCPPTHSLFYYSSSAEDYHRRFTPIKSSLNEKTIVCSRSIFFNAYTIRIILVYIYMRVKAKASDCFENGNEIKYVHLYTVKYSHKPKYMQLRGVVSFTFPLLRHKYASRRFPPVADYRWKAIGGAWEVYIYIYIYTTAKVVWTPWIIIVNNNNNNNNLVTRATLS